MCKVCLPLICLLMAVVQHVEARSWQDEVIYFMMTDRFYDGDPSNNVPEGCDPATYDPKQENVDLYHGGDFRGIELALQSGYFNELGITSIWITPPVKNVWKTAYDEGDSGKTGYHGYWTQDFLDIDPHLTSEIALDGNTYAKGREGRLAHYRDLVKLAHDKGIKIVQDIVCNHIGPLFFYDSQLNGNFDRDKKDEWVAPFKEYGFHDHAQWGEIPEWNIHTPQPDGPLTIFGKTIPFNGVLSDLSTYSRKGFNYDSLGKADGEEVSCDFFSLRDIWTKGGSDHYEELANEFVEIYHFYIDVIGVDGLRIDTVKHVHHEFWSSFSRRLRIKLGHKAKNLILFGEVYDGNPEKLGQYTYRHDNKDIALDSLLNFQMCWAARNYMRHEDGNYGHADGIQRTMEDLHNGPDGKKDYYNKTPGLDGLNSRQKSITFLENHDGINRFRVRGVTEQRNILANALVLTLEGIPCLYYGTEAGLIDEEAGTGDNSETGRMTLFKRSDSASVQEVQKSKSFQAIKQLIAARQAHPALKAGETSSLWLDHREQREDDGVFVFARYLPDQFDQSVIVAFNLSDKKSSVTVDLISNQQEPLLTKGQKLRQLPLMGQTETSVPIEWGEEPKATLELIPQTVSLWIVE